MIYFILPVPGRVLTKCFERIRAHIKQPPCNIQQYVEKCGNIFVNQLQFLAKTIATGGAFSATAELLTADKRLFFAVVECLMWGQASRMRLQYHALSHCLDCYLFRRWKGVLCLMFLYFFQTCLVLLCITFMISRRLPHN